MQTLRENNEDTSTEAEQGQSNKVYFSMCVDALMNNSACMFLLMNALLYSHSYSLISSSLLQTIRDRVLLAGQRLQHIFRKLEEKLLKSKTEKAEFHHQSSTSIHIPHSTSQPHKKGKRSSLFRHRTHKIQN